MSRKRRHNMLIKFGLYAFMAVLTILAAIPFILMVILWEITAPLEPGEGIRRY
jgi:hypothetical protein